MIDDRYTAGFFDGEGCINITQRGKNKQVALRVMIVNTDETILQHLHLAYGGHLSKPKQLGAGWKLFRQLTFTGKAAIEFLRCIGPHLLVKRQQADLALEFWEFMQRPRSERCELVPAPVADCAGRVVTKRTAETIAKELDFKTTMHQLNRKGA